MIRPLANHILVRRDAQDAMSPGGIALIARVDTEFVKEIVTGEVVAVGPGAFDKKGRRETMWGLAPGDRVSFSPVGSVSIPGDGLTMIKRDSVIGALEDRAAA